MRAIDGTGSAPIENARVVVQDGRIVQIGPAEQVAVPDGAETLDLSGKTIVPGLIDLHFHIENDPKLALRQLSNGVTAFRDPGQWNEKFVELRKMIASAGLPGPRIFTTGPHIDGERPAYPADSVVARDAEEARRLAERNIREGGSAVKIYFRLPFDSARAVINVCELRQVPCTAHLEILDARELISAGLHGIEHITSFGVSLLPRVDAEAYRQAVLADNDARRDGRYRMFAGIDLDGPEAQALYSVLRTRQPWVDATLAVFERRPRLAWRHEAGDRRCAGGRLCQDEAVDAAGRARGRSRGNGRPHERSLRRTRRSPLARAGAAGRKWVFAARGIDRRHVNGGGLPL